MTTTPKTLATFECEMLLDKLLNRQEYQDSKPKEIRNFTIALLMLDAGLRVGEVVQLQISDLIFNSVPVTSIIIRAEIAKNKTERSIPVSARLSNALKKMNECWWPIVLKSGVDSAFYNTGTYRPLTTRQVERIIRSAAMKSLGRPVNPHVLRHTFATRLMRKTNSRVVQELLGHSSMTSTQIYTHPNEDDKKKAIDDLSQGEIDTGQPAAPSPAQ